LILLFQILCDCGVVGLFYKVSFLTQKEGLMPAATQNGPFEILVAASDTYSLRIATSDPDLGTQANQFRTYFNKFGMLETQGWIVVSGLFNKIDATNEIQVIYPGGTKGRPTYYVGNRIAGGSGGMLGVSIDTISPVMLSQDNRITSERQVAISATTSNQGTGYAVGDVLNVSGGVFDAAEGTQLDISVEIAGTGYVAATAPGTGDLLSIVGGVGVAATVRVTAIDPVTGGVVAVELENPGNYSSLPPISCPTSGGSGLGCFLNVVWPTKGNAKIIVDSVLLSGAIASARLISPGSYTVLPSNPVSVTSATGTGSGAKFNVNWSNRATLSRHYEALDYTKAIIFQIGGDGRLTWGMGAGNIDACYDIERFVANKANLYPTSRNNLKSDGSLAITGNLKVEGVQQTGNQLTHSLTRSLPTTINQTVDVGTFNLAGDGLGAGSAIFEITIVGSGPANNSKRYVVASYYNATPGIWAIVPEQQFSGQPGAPNFQLEMSQSLGQISFRIRALTAVGATNLYLVINQKGCPTDTFTPSNAVTTPAAATAIYSSTAAISRLVQTKAIATPTTGTTVTIVPGVSVQYIDPAANLAALTVRMPSGPVDGQMQRIVFGKAVTSLTLTATGATVTRPPTSAAIDSFFLFQYNAAVFTWRRVG
jgi:hypothetical protein